MTNRRVGMSQLAVDAGFGTRIWSQAGYWGGRLYHLIVALGTAVIVFFSTVRHVPTLFLAVLLASYGLYLFVRFYLIRGHEFTYYHPYIQFARAQVGIALLTLVIASLGEAGIHNYLWLLYTLQLVIIGRHMNTEVFLAAIVEVCLILIGLRLWITSGSPLSSFLESNMDLIVQCTWITLIGFITHYLLRNIDARDGTITTMGQINTLALQHLTGREWKAHWEAVLETYLRNVGGRRGSVWLFNPHAGQVRSLTGLGYPFSDQSCLGSDLGQAGESILLDADHPIAEVIRTGRPLYCRPQARLDELLPRSRESTRFCDDLPSDVSARIVVPIGKSSSSSARPLGALCIEFDRSHPPRERLLTHYFEFLGNMADWVVPLLQFLQQMEEQQILRRIGVQVSRSLRLENVLEETLDALTGPLGFDLATISLVDQDAELVRCVTGRHVPRAWIDKACHPLNSTDIQADVVRRPEIQVIKGWDDRFDQRIFQEFHHHRLIRAFVPIHHRRGTAGQQPLGVVEVGYYLDHRDQITLEQQELLITFIDQVAVAIEKARLFQSVLQHREVLAQLHRVSHNIACARHPDEVLSHLGDALRDVLRADIVMIYLYDRTTQRIGLPVLSGNVWGRRPISEATLDHGVIAEILQTGQARFVADAATDPLLSQPCPAEIGANGPKYQRTFTARQNIKSFAGVPMLVQGEAVGVLCVNYRRRNAFLGNEQCVLGLAAQLAAVALRNAELNALSAELAVKEERSRLAEQLHDSVSPFITAIPWMADTALRQLTEQPDQAAHWLARIQDASHQTMAEVRANLFEMKVTATQSHNLGQALAEMAQLAREYFQLDVHIAPGTIPDRLHVPIEADLLSVCREAIVNAARHAAARHVTVELSETGGAVRLQVQDDGCGFDLSTLSQQGVRGLHFMRRRVERLGGELTIDSQPGEGTVIEVIVPV